MGIEATNTCGLSAGKKDFDSKNQEKQSSKTTNWELTSNELHDHQQSWSWCDNKASQANRCQQHDCDPLPWPILDMQEIAGKEKHIPLLQQQIEFHSQSSWFFHSKDHLLERRMTIDGEELPWPGEAANHSQTRSENPEPSASKATDPKAWRKQRVKPIRGVKQWETRHHLCDITPHICLFTLDPWVV